MSNTIIIAGTVIILILLLILYKKKSVTTKNSARGKGSMSGVAAWDPKAEIISMNTDRKVSTVHNGMKTVVTFSDGYTYTTYYTKRESKLKLGGASYTYSVDAEIREQIAAAAIEAHSRKA